MLEKTPQEQGTPSAMLSRQIVLVGDQQLATILIACLPRDFAPGLSYYQDLDELERRWDSSRQGLVVALSAHWRPTHDREIQRWCLQYRQAFLRVSIWQREAVIGPLVVPGIPGCVECAERRRLRALIRDHLNERRFLARCENDAWAAARPQNPWIFRSVLLGIGSFATHEIQAFLDDQTSCRGEQSVRFIQLRSLTSSCHTFLPDPTCPLCAPFHDDCEEESIIRFVSRPRPTPSTPRQHSLSDELEQLEKLFIDPRLGLQTEPMPDFRAHAASFAATFTHYAEYPQIIKQVDGSGFTLSYRSSRAVAITEVLERYCGLLPRGKRTVVYGSYHQLQAQALDPVQLGLYHTDQYALFKKDSSPSFSTPYDPERAYQWVWGYSLREQRPILVPEQVIYYASQLLRPPQECFIYESSNGCALGGSLEEAALYGLFEALERDAFFLTWYARLPVPEIDSRSIQDMRLLLSLERVQRMTGFTFHWFDCTTDFDVPVVLCVGVNAAEMAPKMVCAAAAHWNPDRAMASAFYEAASGVCSLIGSFPEQQERAEQLLHDSSLVLTMDDHALVNALPAAFSRIRFLFQDRPMQSLAERFARHYAALTSLDFTADLTRLIGRILARGYDVILVDQTAPELRAANLHCIHTLVPGLVPMAFGHQYRRIHGINRLYRLPQELGYTDHVLTDEELNPYPHPFP